jgi:hypothetical protein
VVLATLDKTGLKSIFEGSKFSRSESKIELGSSIDGMLATLSVISCNSDPISTTAAAILPGSALASVLMVEAAVSSAPDTLLLAELTVWIESVTSFTGDPEPFNCSAKI